MDKRRFEGYVSKSDTEGFVNIDLDGMAGDFLGLCKGADMTLTDVFKMLTEMWDEIDFVPARKQRN